MLDFGSRRGTSKAKQQSSKPFAMSKASCSTNFWVTIFPDLGIIRKISLGFEKLASPVLRRWEVRLRVAALLARMTIPARQQAKRTVFAQPDSITRHIFRLEASSPKFFFRCVNYLFRQKIPICRSLTSATTTWQRGKGKWEKDARLASEESWSRKDGLYWDGWTLQR